MNKNNSKNAYSFRKPIIIIVIWIVLIVISFQARSLLSSTVDESEQFTDATTESGKGALLIQERFNKPEQATHIIILQLPNEQNLGFITDNQWRNYTLFLSGYLNTTLYDRGYDRPTGYLSEPVILLSGLPDAQTFANSLISEDKTIGLMYIQADEDKLDDLPGDVEIIREKLHDVSGFYTYVESQLPPNTISFFMPDQTDAEQVHVLLTGSQANFVDTIKTAQETFESSEIFAVFVVIIILALVFRSPLGLVIPIVALIASLFPTYLGTFVMSELGLFGISDFLPALIAMIGIAVAVDYTLFSLVRFREEFRKRKAKHELANTWTPENIRITQIESAKFMNKTAGTAVMYSGITVIIGFTALLVLGSDFTLSMAASISLVVIFSILTARTLTPAILSIFGRFLDWPNITTRGQKEVEQNKANSKSNNIWVRWSRVVMKHPIKFLVLAVLVLTPFILLSTQAELSFDTVRSLPKGTESREGFEILFNEFNLGEVNPYKIVIDTRTANGVFNEDIIEATNKLGDWALSYKETRSRDGSIYSFKTASSLSFSTNTSTKIGIKMDLASINQILEAPDNTIIPNGTDPIIVPNLEKLIFVNNVFDTYVNSEFGNDTLLIDLTSNLDPGTAAAWELVRIIRNKVSEIFGSLPVETFVTGFAASFSDTSDSMYSDVPLMIIIAVILIYLALMILFRSLLLPAKAILTIGGSILFSLGMLVYVFQEGNFLWLINGEQIGVTFIIPVFLFTIILGLGMDYSIFIISRIKEEHLKGIPSDEAVGIGLAKTAGVVTSAATVMIATFLVFALAPISFLKSMGLAMAVAIFIDATLARTILLPAAMKLAGKWNWYLPEWLKKVLPDVKLDH